MNVLVDISLLKYAKTLAYAGFTVGLYDSKSYSAFDVFDTFRPDMYIGNTSNVPTSLFKAIKEKPHMKLGFFLQGIKDNNFIEMQKEGIEPEFILDLQDEPVADILLYYKGEVKPEFQCDVVVAERFINIDLPNIPTCYTLRIFSPNLVYHINYCGNIQEDNVKHLYASSKVSLCYPENMLNCIVAGGYPLPIDSSEEDIVKAIESVNNKEDLLKHALQRTTFHICSEIMQKFGLVNESEKIMETFKGLVK